MLQKKIVNVVIVLLVCFASAWFLSSLKVTSDVEAESFDIRLVAFPPATPASPDIVMVWLDENTMRGLPFRSPVPRDFLARLNSKLSEAGAKVIVYDIFFKGSSFPEADKSLAESLSKSNSFAVMPLRADPNCNLGTVPDEFDGCVDSPDEMFASSLKGVGLADLPFSAFDATVRGARMKFITDEGELQSISSLVYENVTGNGSMDEIENPYHWPSLGFTAFSPFINEKDEIPIRFSGPPSHIGKKDNVFKVYSAKLVAEGLIPPAWFKDKIVLVGAAYDDATDAYLTPYYKRLTNYARMNGVEIHANVLSSLLTHKFIYSFSDSQKWTYITILILAIGSSSLLLVPLRSFLIFIAIAAFEIACAIFTFKQYAVAVPISLPLGTTVASYAIGIGMRALTEGRQKRFIKGVFARYVPPAVVEKMTEHPEMLKLGGEERYVTSMFTDIASFTSVSEKLDPTTLVAFLNEYLGKMNDVLFKYGATLDKYEGDAIIAFFNAPLEVNSHEKAAINAAIEMQSGCSVISKKWKEKCGREIVTRIGLNSGLAVVGNMGSEGRFDYTAIGDTINLASRLEGTNKFYGTTIMASESCVKSVGDEFAMRPVDRVRVKGKREPILLFEILGKRDAVDENKINSLFEPYNLAFNLFGERKFSEATTLLRDILSKYSSDGPSIELLKRCNRAEGDPSWDLTTDLINK